jgi:hypothetical protein
MLNRLYEYLTGNYVQTSHHNMPYQMYCMIREFAERHHTTIDQVLAIQSQKESTSCSPE